MYTEDTIRTHYDVDTSSTQRPFERPDMPALHLAGSLAVNLDLINYETLQQPIPDITMRILGSIDNMRALSIEFFTGTHQRIPALSKLRFYNNLESLTATPRPSFAALCLAILLIQQTPQGKTVSMQTPLYITVKSLINSLEASGDISLDLAHCRILVTFYEMGHGLHAAAYASVAACARTARAVGLHRKRWRNMDAGSDVLALEEEKRTWWAIVTMERFIGLCNGDALFATNDPERTDPLPVEDLLWSEGSPAYLESHIMSAPSLDTSFNITVGQLARECQIFHLAGRAVRHVFDPAPDPAFNAEEGIQLERTLKAYLPLLADEELRIGKYCGAFGVCNRFVTFSLNPYSTSQNAINSPKCSLHTLRAQAEPESGERGRETSDLGIHTRHGIACHYLCGGSVRRPARELPV